MLSDDDIIRADTPRKRSNGLTGYNQQDVRFSNRMSVLKLIYENKAISRAEIANLTGLNPATVTHITKDLIRLGWIEERGPDKTEVNFGRPRSMLQIKPDARYVFAVNIERFKIEATITDLQFEPVISDVLSTAKSEDCCDDFLTVEEALDFLESVFARSGLAPDQILGMGISAPGPINVSQGALLKVPNFPGWSNLPISQIISDRLGISACVERDANAYALAEKWFGIARDYDKFIYLASATGIGGSLVMNGDLYRGAHDLAGEIGHITVDPQGPRCDCGNVGCLELYITPQKIASRVAQEVRAGHPSQVAGLVNEDPSQITFKDVAEAAAEGDQLCRRIIQESIQLIITSLVTTINIVDPEAVIFGGKFKLLEPVINSSVQDDIELRIFGSGVRQIPLVFGSLCSKTPLLGAYALVIRDFFQDPQNISVS